MKDQISKENSKQWQAIEKIGADVDWIKKELQEIKEQVFNHLPSKIDCLEEKILKNQIKTQSWIIAILVSLVFLLISTILNFLK